MGEKPVVVVKVWAKSSQLSTMMYQVLSNNSIRSPPPTTDRMMIRVRDEVHTLPEDPATGAAII